MNNFSTFSSHISKDSTYSHLHDQRNLIKEKKYFRRLNIHINKKTILWLVRAGVDPCVAKIDLELIKLLLQEENKWSKTRCEVAELEYKRFLTLILWNKDLPYPIIPTVLVDQLWHKHILDTRAYHNDIIRIFGEYLHHFPFLGFGSEESRKLKEQAFLLSCKLYEETFGEPFTSSAKKITFETK